jgi:transposase
VEGGVDGSVYENFVFHLLKGIKSDPELRHRRVVLLMDNARIHHQDLVVATALRESVYILYSAEYSPWLNPVEWYFRHVKQQLASAEIYTR